MALSVTTAHLFDGPDNVSSPFDLFTLGPERRVSQHMSELKYAAAHSRSFFSFFFEEMPIVLLRCFFFLLYKHHIRTNF
jgi:hypothetical protein